MHSRVHWFSHVYSVRKRKGTSRYMTPEEKKSIIETDTRLADLVYDYAWRNVERSTEYFGRIDTKATTLTGIVGVTLTILVSSAGVAFPEARWGDGLAMIAQAAYALSVVSFLVSLAWGIVALSLRDTTDIPFIRDLIAEYRASQRHPHDEVQMKKRISQRLSNVDYSYCFQVSRKIVSIRRSTRFLTIGLICLSVSVSMALLHVTTNTYARTGRSATADTTVQQSGDR